MTLLWIEMMNCFKTPSPAPRGFRAPFSIRFPYYIATWDRLIRNGEIF